MNEFIIVSGLNVKVTATIPLVPFGNVSYEIEMQAELRPGQNELTAARGLTEMIESLIIGRVRQMEGVKAEEWLAVFNRDIELTFEEEAEAFDQELS